MVEQSITEWTDHTFNPWEGCQKVTPECDHSYAEARDIRFTGGTVWPDGSVCLGNANNNGGAGWPSMRIGKKAAGRQLDGCKRNAILQHDTELMGDVSANLY